MVRVKSLELDMMMNLDDERDILTKSVAIFPFQAYIIIILLLIITYYYHSDYNKK